MILWKWCAVPKLGKEKQAFCDIKQWDIRYVDKSWDFFGNLFQKYKRLCCSLISKGKNKSPVVLTGILWHKTKRIQDIWKSWVLFDILFQLIAMLWTSRVKPINCDFFCCLASTINRRLSCQRLYALLVDTLSPSPYITLYLFYHLHTSSPTPHCDHPTEGSHKVIKFCEHLWCFFYNIVFFAGSSLFWSNICHTSNKNVSDLRAWFTFKSPWNTWASNFKVLENAGTLDFAAGLFNILITGLY